jgi:hypothetical protein
MSLDFATVSTLVVSLAILVFFVFTLRATEKRTERKIREVAHQAALIGSDDLARDLCRAVRKQYPRACPGLDFTISEDERGVHIDAWYLPGPEPVKRRVDSSA